MTVLVVAKVIAALVRAGSSVAGALRPGIALAHTEPVTTSTDLYARAYEARADSAWWLAR